MSIATFEKDPGAVLDYTGDWSAWLGTDTITASTWNVPAGITKDTDNHDTTTTWIWLSGGAAGTVYTLTNHITTAGGRQDERTIKIKVKDL